MAFPMQVPPVERDHLNVFEPKRDTEPDTSVKKRRRTRYPEHKRDTTQPREESSPGGTNSSPDDTGVYEGRTRFRSHPRQVRRNSFKPGKLDDNVGQGKYGRLVGRQSNPTATGENVNQGGQVGNGNEVGNANANGNGIGNGNANGNGVGNGNANGNPPNPRPSPGAEEKEEEEAEESESDSDSEDEAGEVEAEEEEEEEQEPEEPESSQDQNKGELSPSGTGTNDLEASQTAAAVITGDPTAGSSTSALCDPSASPQSDSCEPPERDLLQPFQKAAIATGATVTGIIALLVFAFFFMRSRHGSDYTSWPGIRRYGRRRRFRLNSNTESGITILPPPPFQKEDPWIITKERQSWAATRKPQSEMKKHYKGPSKLQNTPLVRRLLGAPLESNPVTPPSISSPLHPRPATGPMQDFDPSQTPDLFSPRDNNRLTISTRSSQAIPEDEQPEISDTRSERSEARPQNARRLPGVSYFSWTTSTPTSTGLNKYQSLMSRSAGSNKRETTTTVDSEPARFRTISSWVNQQYKRVNKTNEPLPPPVPVKDRVSVSSPRTARVADSPLKQSMEQTASPPTKPPLLLSKPTPPHPPIRAAPLPPSLPEASPVEVTPEPAIPPVPPVPAAHSLPPPPPTPLKPRGDNKYHQRTVSVSTNGTTSTPESMHRKNASSTTSSLPTVFKHHPGEKVEINRI